MKTYLKENVKRAIAREKSDSKPKEPKPLVTEPMQGVHYHSALCNKPCKEIGYMLENPKENCICPPGGARTDCPDYSFISAKGLSDDDVQYTDEKDCLPTKELEREITIQPEIKVTLAEFAWLNNIDFLSNKECRENHIYNYGKFCKCGLKGICSLENCSICNPKEECICPSGCKFVGVKCGEGCPVCAVAESKEEACKVCFHVHEEPCDCGCPAAREDSCDPKTCTHWGKPENIKPCGCEKKYCKEHWIRFCSTKPKEKEDNWQEKFKGKYFKDAHNKRFVNSLIKDIEQKIHNAYTQGQFELRSNLLAEIDKRIDAIYFMLPKNKEEKQQNIAFMKVVSILQALKKENK